MKNTKMTCLCESCIEAIRSRGERVLVGERISEYNFDEFGFESKTDLICEWCEEEDDELYECYF